VWLRRIWSFSSSTRASRSRRRTEYVAPSAWAGIGTAGAPAAGAAADEAALALGAALAAGAADAEDDALADAAPFATGFAGALGWANAVTETPTAMKKASPIA
jgi:hypothetical protein